MNENPLFRAADREFKIWIFHEIQLPILDFLPPAHSLDEHELSALHPDLSTNCSLTTSSFSQYPVKHPQKVLK
jgi:hypothetical protein